MNIVQFNELGNPADVLTLAHVTDQAPGAGEVKVKVLAAPIHPANLLQIAGAYLAPTSEFPATPGQEGIGVVSEIGEGVSHLQVGQNVLLAGVGGTWRDEIVASAMNFVPVPAGDVEQLAMIAVNPMTAHLLLTDFGKLESGDWIIQSAANSAVGEMVIQLAALRGINTVNVVRREELILPLKSLGGTVVLLDGPDLAERVAEATGGAPIKLAFEAVGGETYDRLIDSLSFGGTIISYGNMSGTFPPLNMGALIARDIRARGFWLQNWYQNASPEEKKATLDTLASLIISGEIKTKIDSRYPLEEVKEAVIRAAAGGRDGKVLLTPNHA